MGAAVFAFYLFALSTITGGLFTVLSRNPVHSVSVSYTHLTLPTKA